MKEDFILQKTLKAYRGQIDFSVEPKLSKKSFKRSRSSRYKADKKIKEKENFDSDDQNDYE